MLKPVNGFILVKQLKKWISSMFGEDAENLPNEFEIIDISEDVPYEKSPSEYKKSIKDISIGDTIIKWIHSWDLITVDWEEFFIIRPENILWIKTNQ